MLSRLMPSTRLPPDYLVVQSYLARLFLRRRPSSALFTTLLTPNWKIYYAPYSLKFLHAADETRQLGAISAKGYIQHGTFKRRSQVLSIARDASTFSYEYPGFHNLRVIVCRLIRIKSHEKEYRVDERKS